MRSRPLTKYSMMYESGGSPSAERILISGKFANAWRNCSESALRRRRRGARVGVGDGHRRAALLATRAAPAEVLGDAEGGATVWTGEVDHPPAPPAPAW